MRRIGRRPPEFSILPQDDIYSGLTQLGQATAIPARPEDAVLVKASRSAGLEAVAAALLDQEPTP